MTKSALSLPPKSYISPCLHPSKLTCLLKINGWKRWFMSFWNGPFLRNHAFVFLGGVSGISTFDLDVFCLFFAQKPRQLSLETFGRTKTLNLMHMFIAKIWTGRVRVVTKVVVAGIARYVSSRTRRGPQQKDQLMVNWLVVFHQPIWKNMLVTLGIFPLEGVKIKNVWNHHLVTCWFGAFGGLYSWDPPMKGIVT